MRAAVACLLAATVGGAPGGAADPSPVDPRVELTGLRNTLEASVRRVSRSVAPPPSTPQVYRLKGYGSIVVLSPRVLPARRRAADGEAQALAQAVRGLEESLKRVRSTELREQIQASLYALRQTEARRGRGGHRGVVRELTPAEAEALGLSPEDLRRLQRELHDSLAAQAAAFRQAQEQMHRQGLLQEDELTREFALMQEQAEVFRLAVERMRAQAEQDVLGRLRYPLAPPAAAVPPVPPAPPAPPAPEALPGLLPPEAPDAPPPPPWRFWIETEEDGEEEGEDPPTEDALVAQVREAVVAGLESHRGPLSLPAQEYVATAVDFVSRDGRRRRTARTLVVRVRAGDLAERRAGRLTPADFRKRVAFEVD